MLDWIKNILGPKPKPSPRKVWKTGESRITTIQEGLHDAAICPVCCHWGRLNSQADHLDCIDHPGFLVRCIPIWAKDAAIKARELVNEFWKYFHTPSGIN